MSIVELVQALTTLKYPLAYLQFKTNDNTPPPSPPFIVWIEDDSSNVAADNRVYKKVKNYTIELYTEKKDLKVEKQIEDLLDSHSIYYDTSDFFIEKENLLQRSYYVTLIEK